MKTTAALPKRLGAGASFHGGFLATDKPVSAHLLAPKIRPYLQSGVKGGKDDGMKER